MAPGRRPISYEDDPLDDMLLSYEPAAPAARGGFSLHDPEDELTASLLDEPRPRFTMPAEDPNAAPPPPPAPKSDPELEAKYRQAQMSALDRANYDPNDYGVGEAVRDNGAAALASLLDIGFNKGRGLAGIVGATAQGVSKQEAARRDAAKQAGELAVSLRGQGRGGMAGGDPGFDRWYKERLIARGVDVGDRARDKEQGVDERFRTRLGEQQSIDSKTSQTKIGLAAATTDAREDAKHANIDRTADDAALVSGARSGSSTTARNKANETTPPPITPQQRADNDLNERKFAHQKTRDDELDDLRGQTAALKKTAERRQSSDAYRNKMKDILLIAQAARHLDQMYNGAGGSKDKPGIGAWDSIKPGFMRSKADDDAAKELAFLRSYEGKDITGAAAGGKDETQRINELAGSTKGGTEQSSLASIQKILETSRAQLRAGMVGHEDVARDVLAEYGLEDLAGPGDGRAAAKIQNDYGQQSGKRIPEGNQPAGGSPQPMAADEKTPHKVRKPDGSRVVYDLTEAQFQKLMRTEGFGTY